MRSHLCMCLCLFFCLSKSFSPLSANSYFSFVSVKFLILSLSQSLSQSNRKKFTRVSEKKKALRYFVRPFVLTVVSGIFSAVHFQKKLLKKNNFALLQKIELHPLRSWQRWSFNTACPEARTPFLHRSTSSVHHHQCCSPRGMAGTRYFSHVRGICQRIINCETISATVCRVPEPICSHLRFFLS